MTSERKILFWRRIDVPGLERLVLEISSDAIIAEATTIGVENGGFRLDHRWKLTPDWRTLSLEVARWGPSEDRTLRLERTDGGWRVDGMERADLNGADEPDLSITPFCNTMPIRRAPAAAGEGLTLSTCYVDAAAMTVTLSRQRYERLGHRRLRYVDLGVAAGFEAELRVDDDGLIISYQHLFERVPVA
jgi:hypothetical protein